MDVLAIVLIVVIGGGLLVAAVYWTAVVAVWVWIVVEMSWPLLLGITIGAFVWYRGFDNIGMLLILAGIVGQAIWTGYTTEGISGSSYDPMEGKTRIYDKSGNIIGYTDND